MTGASWMVLCGKQMEDSDVLAVAMIRQLQLEGNSGSGTTTTTTTSSGATTMAGNGTGSGMGDVVLGTNLLAFSGTNGAGTSGGGPAALHRQRLAEMAATAMESRLPPTPPPPPPSSLAGRPSVDRPMMDGPMSMVVPLSLNPKRDRPSK